MRRVVITGMGAVTPIGNTVEEFWKSVLESRVGIGEISRFDTSDFKVKLAAEVKDFDPGNVMDFRTAKRMSRFSQYAVCATDEAIKQSGLDLTAEDPYRMGVCVGSGVGGMQDIEEETMKLAERGPSRVKPLLVPMMITNIAAGNIAIAYGLRGKCINVVTACTTGTHSVGEAYRAIQVGDADVMVAGGTESAITPVAVAGFTSLTAVTTETDASKASIPFDQNRSGFVMGEGAGILVLEEYEHAKKRGATILAELVGYGATCDAYHITSPAEDGAGAAKAMELAMKEAGVAPEQVDYINAHGTSTHHNDLFEARAMRMALGEKADAVPFSSTKSMVGHLLGAAGAVELIACVKSIQEGYIHENVGTTQIDEELDLNYVTGQGLKKSVQVAMSNSLGFGGHNATLIVKKPEV